MNLQQAKVGARYYRHGSEYEISRIDKRRVIVRNVIGGNTKTYPHNDFNVFLKDNGIELITPPLDLRHVDDTYLDKKDIQVRDYRLNVVEDVLSETHNYSCRTGKNAAIVIRIIKKASKKHGMKPRSISSVSRWVKTFIESNYNPNSLLPQYKLRRTKFNDQVELLIDKKIDENLISNRRVVKKFLTEEVLIELEKSIDSGVIPSRRTIIRRIDGSDPSKILQNIHGTRKARKLTMAAGKSRHTSRALECVEADGNNVDLILVDTETGEVLGRVYLTVFIDVYTRCVLSFHLTHTPFSGFTFLEAFKGALNEENGLPGGKIQRLIVDNGSDYISESAKNVCNLTKTEIEIAPPGTPNAKPHVERFFRTLNQQFIHQLPGTTFSSPHHKSEYSSDHFACIDIKTLREALHEFINIYNNSHHQGLNGIPSEIWRQAKKKNRLYSYDSKTVNNFAKLSVLRTINKGRIYFEGLHWYSHALRTLELQMDQNKTKQKVQVFIDESNLSNIFVKCPFSESLIQADSVKPEYTKGLSLFEHRHISQLPNYQNSKSSGLSATEALRLRIQLRDELLTKLDKHSRKVRARLSDGNSARALQDKYSLQEDLYSSEQELAESYFSGSDNSSEDVNEMQAVLITGGLTSNSSETGGADS